MNGQNQNPNKNQSDNKGLGNKADQTQPNIPPPDNGPQGEMRTMESDVNSIKESGGGAPEPQVIRPEDLSIGKEQQAQVPPSSQEQVKKEPQLPQSIEGKDNSWIWWTLGVVVGIVILLAIGWWVYSAYFTTPLEELLPEAGEESAVNNEGIEPPLPPETPLGQSIFGFSENEIETVDVDGYKVVGILAALQGVADSFSADGQVKEVRLNIQGQSADPSLYLSTFLPELERSSLINVLDTEFGGELDVLLYRQNAGVWPVYVIRKNPVTAISEADLLEQLSTIEETSVGNLYLTPPMGDVEFKTGPVGDKYSSRYTSYEEKPASFNYGLFGDYLILSTTYQGLTRAIELLEI